ncbi:hypothetical protein Ssi03_44690 [Sphaerisporangium siamense]|uniref:Extradiol ring-cleavage dioxygenase class III enzyme subunit B domain-containing protein n=1 Tax=Sphaerisporangium siamense TaxID=795645 RepID=A0A7W7GED7_9ACTN|nr:class III extradiol dioxygenase subunit B-like domain-containing protein [Sphaerisporangium siamense]MBB4705369.1 hypothetical protein [Sphaerisporangium siamense]GII86479.1 hypothetical protein Ssi03_44690 [Sphaerisporangium siamense]
MLVAAAVCPHPPLIVPGLAGEASPELEPLRLACVAAVRSLAAARPDTLITVGGADATRSYAGDAAGGLAPWGGDVRVGSGPPVLPLSLTIGRWLLDLAGAGVPAAHQAVASDASSGECARLGRALAARGERVALLVMGDGSARLTVKSPGYLHPAAAGYDRALVRALGGADAGALAALDPAEAEELWVAGRAAFQVLAGAAGDRRMTGEALYDEAPYGVGYLVASWSQA